MQELIVLFPSVEIEQEVLAEVVSPTVEFEASFSREISFFAVEFVAAGASMAFAFEESPVSFSEVVELEAAVGDVVVLVFEAFVVSEDVFGASNSFGASVAFAEVFGVSNSAGVTFVFGACNSAGDSEAFGCNSAGVSVTFAVVFGVSELEGFNNSLGTSADLLVTPIP
jgi:hypothetical protein